VLHNFWQIYSHNLVKKNVKTTAAEIKYSNQDANLIAEPFSQLDFDLILPLAGRLVAFSLGDSTRSRGQTVANGTIPGPSVQLQMWVCIYILEFHTHLQNGLFYSGKLDPNKF
jgi:hypothetical protein